MSDECFFFLKNEQTNIEEEYYVVNGKNENCHVVLCYCRYFYKRFHTKRFLE